MIDYCLKFPDEATGHAALFDGEQAKYLAIDVIGVIYKPTGKMLTTDEGDVPVVAPIAGWHANVRADGRAPELEPWQVFPQTPRRVWA